MGWLSTLLLARIETGTLPTSFSNGTNSSNTNPSASFAGTIHLDYPYSSGTSGCGYDALWLAVDGTVRVK